VTGSVGMVKVTDRFRGRVYVDYLSIVRVGEVWKIVNKTFTTLA